MSGPACSADEAGRSPFNRLVWADEFNGSRIAARMKLSAGQGSWPAFWMTGDDIDSASWPKSGEIDIMELAGGLQDHNGLFPDSRNDWTINGTLHGQGCSGDRGITGACRIVPVDGGGRTGGMAPPGVMPPVFILKPPCFGLCLMH
ncbi:MAG: family 16 glycosylhydrolase [Candidatus Xenobiia bacterium LiM19]